MRDGRVYSIPPSVRVKAFFTPGSPYWEDGAIAPAGQAPGIYFTYCNLSTALGTVIEAVTGQRFDEYQKAHILAALDCRGRHVPGNLEAAEFAKLGTVYLKRDSQGRWDEQGPWQGTIDDLQRRPAGARSLALRSLCPGRLPDLRHLAAYRPGTNATITARRPAPVSGENWATSWP